MTDTPNKPGDAIRRAYRQSVGATIAKIDGRCVMVDKGPTPDTPEHHAAADRWVDDLIAAAAELGVDISGDDWQSQVEQIAKQLPKERRDELFYTPPPHVDVSRMGSGTTSGDSANA